MVLIRRTPRLTCDNSLVTFINVEEEEFTLEDDVANGGEVQTHF
jgi:hypothetical protein